MFNRRTILMAAVAAGLAMSSQAGAQEVGMSSTTTATPMSSNLVPVTDAMLRAAGSDAKNWLHSNGSYEQTRYYPGSADQHHATSASSSRRSCSRPTVLESMETAPIVVDGVMFLTTSFNHVYAINAVDRRGILALQAQDGADHDVLLRPEQPRRRDRGRSRCSWARSTRSSSRSTPRPARCCGKRRSPIPRRATRRRWRPSSSTARC